MKIMFCEFCRNEATHFDVTYWADDNYGDVCLVGPYNFCDKHYEKIDTTYCIHSED